jgi:hypothetical protein
MADAIGYLRSEVRPVMERSPGYLGTSLLLDPRQVSWVRIVLDVEQCAHGIQHAR